ncbi:Cob(I)yrinic acid a,c-diamide adenosyltransferase [Candidatus Terasakiella magnetica]|uniref:Corrinoid adenosyltransferase n=1 Tax=Candidatus Terasakiella magnetica TaxID=1867952 RepID=A0A1C3RGG3_9PROT|nr:cob(I)yrinic acid a,c-diamide adenosyltransferase [Candidatus Terasakiella magnetica]SCA56393.1 Cob(I)yrinic acid a,c-diamide adenosyltransferase [Candidatus Terasakiella magnetica]
MSEEDLQKHASKMAKKKAARDRMMEKKIDEKGLVIVHTGKGKGKSSSAFGMALRCVGHGFKVGVIQFIKGAWDTAERRVFEGFPDQVTFKAMGEGFTWETQDKERDIAAAQKAWAAAKEMIESGEYRMVILDEINVAMRYDYISEDDVLECLENRPDLVHVVLTGRHASEKLLDVAELATEMTLVKHPFRSGIKAQPGVEF